MRVLMPLFEFECNSIRSYSFNDCGIAIQPLEIEDLKHFNLTDLSQLDAHHINSASWVLTYDGDDSAYKSFVNLLLMSFRIFLDHSPPFIKYRLIKDNNQVTCISQTMTYNYSVIKELVSYERVDLELVDTSFKHLREMDVVSARTHNSLYFLYRAFHSDKWIDSFVLMMCSLESLFSKDKEGGATKAITSRVSSFLDSRTRCTKSDIENLYDLRSAMTHGRLVASDDARDNLKQLDHLEYVVVQCFRELVKKNAYVHYETKDARDMFIGTLG